MKKENKVKLLTTIENLIFFGRNEDAISLVKIALSEGVKPIFLVESVINSLDYKHEELPETLLQTRTALTILAHVLLQIEEKKIVEGNVLIGAVKDDLHNIGITIATGLLSKIGLKVIDLGVDVQKDEFILQCEKQNADIVIVTCNVQRALFNAKTIIEDIKINFGDKVKIITAGEAFTPKSSWKLGADFFCENPLLVANECIKIIKEQKLKQIASVLKKHLRTKGFSD